ncbi:MAG: DUF29 domain-containing protein [Leptolyngbyaceae cyanobacterium]
MVTNIEKRLAEDHTSQSLYEQDFLLWSEETVAKLKAKDFENLDLENLIEEVDSLGRSQRKELSSRLTRLLEHLLKRLYVNLPENYRGWEDTIRNQRTELDLLIQDSPSLKSIWAERFERAWKVALKNVSKGYKDYSFPDCWPYEADIESILEGDFWEE